MNDSLQIKGNVLLQLRDSTGALKEHREIQNMVVTTGLQLAAQALGNGTITAIVRIAVGTNNTAVALGQTTLSAELTRVALTGTNVTGSTITYTTTLGAGVGTGALVEAGTFNNAAGGTMLSRVVFPVINKAAGDTLGITWTLTLG